MTVEDGSGTHLPLWGRLSFRFSFILVVMLLLVYVTGGPLRRLGASVASPLRGAPEPAPAEEPEGLDLEPLETEPEPEDLGPDEVILPPYIDLLHISTGPGGPDDLNELVHMLAGTAQPDDTGRWVPPPMVVEMIDHELRLLGKAYAWLDAERRVIVASERLGLEPGVLVPAGALQTPEEVLDMAQEEPEHPMVYTMCAPVVMEGAVAGWFEMYTVGEPHPDMYEVDDGEFEVPDEVRNQVLGEYGNELREELETEFEGRVADAVAAELEAAAAESDFEMRVGSLVELGLFVVVAGIASLLLSWLVTNRLSRLTAEAEAPGEEGGLPGPFPDEGNDEIAVLARSMNAMRERTLALVQETTDRDARRRRWVAQVSHDLRTPLTALTAVLERAREDLESGTSLDEVRANLSRRLTTAHMDAERVGNLADDLLDIARLDTEKALVLEPVPPGELARQVLRMMRPMAEGLERELIPDVARGLPQLDADGNRLMRGLENLLRNALQHSVRTVTLRVREHDASIRFEVLDDGAGLPPEPDGTIDLERLAGQLSRSDSAGLGLVVARRVAEAHGGRIGAENLATGGAAVWLDIPLG